MKQTIDDTSQFRDAFRAMDRHGYFSYEGMELLFNYLEELNPDYELDVIELCCEYAESTPDEIVEAYGIESDDEDEPDAAEAATAYLEANTTVIGTTSTGAIVYASNF